MSAAGTDAEREAEASFCGTDGGRCARMRNPRRMHAHHDEKQAGKEEGGRDGDDVRAERADAECHRRARPVHAGRCGPGADHRADGGRLHDLEYSLFRRGGFDFRLCHGAGAASSGSEFLLERPRLRRHSDRQPLRRRHVREGAGSGELPAARLDADHGSSRRVQTGDSGSSSERSTRSRSRRM